MVGEQPYKNRDMAGSDSGLGHLLVNVTLLAKFSFLSDRQRLLKNSLKVGKSRGTFCELKRVLMHLKMLKLLKQLQNVGRWHCKYF